MASSRTQSLRLRSRADASSSGTTRIAGLSAFLLVLSLNGVLLLAQTPATNSPAPVTVLNSSPSNSLAGANPGNTNQTDWAAARFATTCAGCHSLTVKLTGPPLAQVGAWPTGQLKAAIKRMEKNVGPLTDGQITELADLLKSPRVNERIKTAQARIQAQFMAKMAPPDAAIGKALFLGRRPLLNGGLQCSACHTAAGFGGNLGPNLNGVYAKMGDMALVSAIQKAAFKVMEPAYRDHPVTTQEAMHLAKYFSTLNPKAAPTAPFPYAPVGTGCALAGFVSMAFYYHRGRSRREPTIPRRRK